jgi:anhydro-N-acetylmuramic acid kinase
MRIIGLISGTSVDGIDAALIEISGQATDITVNLVEGQTYPYPPALREQILAVIAGQALTMAEFAALDDAIARQFAQAALTIQANHPPADLIGSHGQTVYHQPPGKVYGLGGPDNSSTPLHPLNSLQVPPPSLGYSLQLGRGAAIAYLTGITTISNFRAADIAAGGQGAPLVPPVDACLLTHDTLDRCIQNIGGIGNVAFLPAKAKASAMPASILGWDTGPGNTLLDLAVQQLSQGEKTYDQDGAWAATGQPCQPLVERWLQQDFFQQPPPKSTGREEFGLEYLRACLADITAYSLTPADILATLTEFTAASIVQSYRQFLPYLPDQVLLCGGGSRNVYLRRRLQALLGSIPVDTTDDVGLSVDFKEAIAFAVLAYWRIQGFPGNLPEATGAKKPVLLGDIHLVA